MIVIGLTGGFSSGKSTVSRMLNQLGAVVLDADKVGHEAFQPHTEAWQEVIATFGKDILLPNGEIDRKKLGGIVFNDAKALSQLNQIMHPRMYLMMQEKIEELRKQGVSVVVLEAAVLLEAGWTPLVDEVWVTTASEATVIRRARERDGITEAQIRARFQSQLSSEERIKQADVVINTDCSLGEVESQVNQLWRRLLAQESGAVSR